MKYLYIFEDGSVKKSDTAPEKGDLLCIADGVLDVIVFEKEDIFQIDGSGEHGDIDSCEIKDNDYH